MTFDNIIALVPVLIIFLFAGYICYGLFLLIKGSLKKLTDNVALSLRSKADIRGADELEKYLTNRFSYYDRLPEKLKIKFLLRVRSFISNKTFEGREGIEVTNEMKVWVAASAVQLTFGLHKFSLSRFSRIIIYPEAFYNRQNDAMHMGETNLRGIIVLSWRDLQEGFEKPADNFNVGLHEMAHALEFQLLLKDDYDTFFGNYYSKWSLIAQDEFENVENERESFLRKYAGVNKREFFAVCIEYFFESGEEFRSRLPQIYYHLCILLNQDPLHEDAHVDEVKRKTEQELLFEISAVQPVLIPEFASWTLVLHAAYFLFIFSMLVIQGFKSTTELLYVSVVVAAIAISILIYKLNRIVLYENYLAIKSPFGKIKSIYELDNIVAINLSSERSGDYFQVLQARHGRIIRSSHAYVARGSDMDLLQQKLREKKIVVR